MGQNCSLWSTKVFLLTSGELISANYIGLIAACQYLDMGSVPGMKECKCAGIGKHLFVT